MNVAFLLKMWNILVRILGVEKCKNFCWFVSINFVDLNIIILSLSKIKCKCNTIQNRRQTVYHHYTWQIKMMSGWKKKSSLAFFFVLGTCLASKKIKHHAVWCFWSWFSSNKHNQINKRKKQEFRKPT